MRVLAIGLALVAVYLAACDYGGDVASNPAPSESPAASGDSGSAEETLKRFVERRLGLGFVADCEDAKRPDDIGKQCAHFRGEKGELRAYELGPTFSRYTRLIILKRIDDGWTIEHLESRDPAAPPVPGIPWPLAVGEDVSVAGTDSCLVVHEEPGQRAPEVACLADGTRVRLNGGPIDAEGLQWWRLQGFGWAASNWLRYPEEVTEQPATAGPQAGE